MYGITKYDSQNRYDEWNTTQIKLKLNNKTDAHILAWIRKHKYSNSTSVQGAIKALIREDISRQWPDDGKLASQNCQQVIHTHWQKMLYFFNCLLDGGRFIFTAPLCFFILIKFVRLNLPYHIQNRSVPVLDYSYNPVLKPDILRFAHNRVGDVP